MRTDSEMYFLQSFKKFSRQIYLGPACPLTLPYPSSPTSPALPTRWRLQIQLPERTHDEHT